MSQNCPRRRSTISPNRTFISCKWTETYSSHSLHRDLYVSHADKGDATLQFVNGPQATLKIHNRNGERSLLLFAAGFEKHKSIPYKGDVQTSLLALVIFNWFSGSITGIVRFQIMNRWTVCMRPIIIVFGVCLITACAPVTENTPGEVFTMGDEELIIVGPKRDGKPAYPTNRMFEQAKSVCSSAYFINARPSLSKPSSFDYLFRC